MEKSKYYTPEINEFFVGFEYEHYHENCDSWLKCYYDTMYDQRESSDLDELHMDKERVKYLDKSDIESLGFNIKAESHPWFKSVDNSGPDAMYFNKFIDKMELILFYSIEINKLEIHIQVPCNKDYTTYKAVFIGTIKNKSELIKLLKMLSINA